jgi:heme exporter protein D
MDLGPHAAFIVGAYAVAGLIVAAMIAWVLIDHRRQARILADLEARGVTRRSERAGAREKAAAGDGKPRP